MQNTRTGKTSCSLSDTTSGVSEIIGAVLLISLVVLAVSIIAMLLFSQATPEKIPNINFMTGSDNSNRLYLYHNGGDSLARGTFSVKVDNDIHNDYAISDGSSDWSLGKNVIVPNIPSGQHSVAIVYNGTGTGTVVLRSATSNVVVAPASNNPDIRPVATYPPIISIPQLMQNVSSRSVMFYRNKNSGIAQSLNSYVKFNVTLPNSTIWASTMGAAPACGSNPFSLNVGDQVTITQTDIVTQGFRVSGIGNQMWELTADNVALSVTDNTGASRCSQASAILNHTLITGYSDLKTNLSINAPAGTNAFTALTIYNYMTNTTPQSTSQIANSFLAATDAYTINNVSPNSVGYFVFQLDNSTKSVYFAGNSTRILRNGIQIYP
jgi:hypothetical protein